MKLPLSAAYHPSRLFRLLAVAVAVGISISTVQAFEPATVQSETGMADVAEVADGTLAAGAQPRPADALGTRAELDAWLDGFVRAQLAAHDIPGAAIAVVDRDGAVVVRGFGHRDAARSAPIAPDRTLFRIASITKTFTWALVMQDVLAGRLDLSADVNGYLDGFQLPLRDGRPVTLADLMTHSAGFEERGIGLLARDLSSLEPLAQWLATQQPALVRMPGLLPAYSNYGTALAGHIVAARSDAPWETLVEDRLLGPLGMTRTVTRQPLPDAVRGDFSPGFRRVDGRLTPISFELLRGAPAGAMSATAADLARWLEAILDNGRVNGEPALDPALVTAMTTPLRRFETGVPPFLHGFYGLDRAGERIFGHHGNLNGTQSLFAVLPDRGIGFFAVYNSFQGNAVDALLDAFVARLGAQGAVPPRQPPTDFEARAERYAGEYAPTRRNHSTIEKAALLAGALTVRATGDGHLVTRSVDGRQRQWVEISPDTFRERDGHARLVFGRDEGGALRLWLGNQALGAHERQTALHAPSTHRTLLSLLAAILLAALIGYPATALRSGERLVFGELRRLPPAAVTAGWLTSAVGLAVLVAIIGALSATDAFFTGVPTSTRVAIWGAALFGLLVLWHATSTAASVLARDGTLGQRVRLGIVATANLLLLAMLCYWNLMPWGLP